MRVLRNGNVLSTLTGYHTAAWIDTIPEPENDRTTGSLPPVNGPPHVIAAASPVTGIGSVSVAFDATSSDDPDGDPLSYEWDFGDGTIVAGAKPNHTFVNSGTDPVVRTVTLTATDPSGATGTDTINVVIYAP